ncbi:MAG: caspase family protein, partial [Verrucomicrobiota bacterium]
EVVLPREEPKENAEPPPVVVNPPPRKPLNTVEGRLENQWNGTIEVYSSSRDISAPKGFQLLAEPKSDGRVLQSTSQRQNFSAKAVLTAADGISYYVSGWSWSRAMAGSRPNWMRLHGAKPKVVVKTEEEASPVAPIAPKEVIRPTAPTGRVVALLVGNGRYSALNPGQRMLDLRDPGNNAELIGDTLRAMSAEVRVVTDVDLSGMQKAIQETVDSLHPGDVFLFYYGGHGIQIGGKNFLAPLGVSLLDSNAVRRTTYPLDDLLSLLSDRKLRFSALFVDASRKNPFNSVDPAFHIFSRIPGFRGNAGSEGNLGLKNVRAGENQLVSLSAEPGTVSVDSDRNSLYSKYASALASALREDTEIREVLAYVDDRLREWTGGTQKPWVSSTDFEPFYLHTPGRGDSASPDEVTLTAGKWIAREGDTGLPLAMAMLSRSVRLKPEANPATDALLFLLSFQAIPVPVNSWGPFDTRIREYEPEMESSINGQYLALYEKGNRDNPGFVFDRDRGREKTQIADTFMPGYGAEGGLRSLTVIPGESPFHSLVFS